MTAVFFLFLVHLALGLLAALAFVPDRAGPRFFKFCAAASAFSTTAALGLAYRHRALSGGSSAPGEAASATLLAATTAFLILVMLYNRAWHFGWRRATGPLLAACLAAGGGLLWLGAPAAARPLVLASDATSVLLLGAATTAMVLGHWYLVVLDLPIHALRRLTMLLIAALALRTLVLGIALAGPVHAGFAEARAIVAGAYHPDGVFVWMRLLFGIAGPYSLLWFIWKTVEIRSTQSATGILYVQLFLVLSGELLAKYLRVAAQLPL
jgi:hypothetical protein